MNNVFEKTYLNIISLKHIDKDIFEFYQKPKCLFESVNFSVISEMNDNIFPIPKTLLSKYVKNVFDNGFIFVSEEYMENIIKDVKNSENFDILKINIKKLELTKNKKFLFICLPYKESIWKNDLKQYFSENEIKKIFEKFNNANGVSGTYHSGFLMIINADKLHELKVIEEVVEHEFVHMFEDINDEENEDELSFDILSILGKPLEFKTYTINLMNRLDKIFNRYCIENSLNNSDKVRNDFLNKIFNLAEKITTPELFISKIRYYDNSEFLSSNMYFLWNMVHWRTKEFKKFKEDIYDHFLKEI